MSGFGRVVRWFLCSVAAAMMAIALTASSAAAAGELAIEPEKLTFAVLPPGQDDSQTLTVRNAGPDSVQLSDIYIVGDVDPFDFLGGSCDLGVILPAAGECSLTLEFAPGEAGDFEVALVVEGGPSEEPAVATLTGRSRPPGKLVATPGSVDFGGVRPNTPSSPQTVRIHNDGGTPIDINSISALGVGARITSNGCGNELAPLATCDVSVVFQPISALTIGTSERAIQKSELVISARIWDQFRTRSVSLRVPMSGTVLKPSGKPYPSKQALTESLKARLSRMASTAIRLVRGGPARPLWLRFRSDGLDAKLGLTLRARVGKRWIAIADDATAVDRDAGARFSFQLTEKGKRLLRKGRPVRVKAETRFAAIDRFVLGAAIKVTEQAQLKPAKPKKQRKRR